MCRNAAQHAARHSISRHKGALKLHAHTHSPKPANAVVRTTTRLGMCFIPVSGFALNLEFSAGFLPGAVLTVDVVPEGWLVVLKVVLGLFRDADFFPHGI